MVGNGSPSKHTRNFFNFLTLMLIHSLIHTLSATCLWHAVHVLLTTSTDCMCLWSFRVIVNFKIIQARKHDAKRKYSSVNLWILYNRVKKHERADAGKQWQSPLHITLCCCFLKHGMCGLFKGTGYIRKHSYLVLFTKYHYSKQIKKHNWEQHMALVMA